MIDRRLTPVLVDALADTPVVFLAGARQTGKSTLARHLARSAHPAAYQTLDDLTALASARRDPAGFVAGLGDPVVLDEVQRVPELLLAIKAVVDRDRRPGRFLLTGSANVLAIPQAADALVGRMEVYTLWPFSQGEIEGVREGFVDTLFRPEPRLADLPPPTLPRDELRSRITRGGYPEILRRAQPGRRRAWFEGYLTTLVQRDMRDLAAIEGLAEIPRLLGLVAARIGSHVNIADISRTAGVPQTTLRRYLGLLEGLFLVHRLPAWSGNLGARLLRTPKLYLSDTGLAANVLGLDAAQLAAQPDRMGPLIECFVVNELAKQATWSTTPVRLYHFRTDRGQEVDVVLEDPSGRCVAVEVKAAATLTARDAAGVLAFRELAGSRFHQGVVLYTGTSVVPLASNVYAVPVSTVWSHSAEVTG